MFFRKCVSKVVHARLKRVASCLAIAMILTACSTQSSCPLPKANLVLFAVRSSAGVVPISAGCRIGEQSLLYGYAKPRCAVLILAEVNSVHAAVQAPKLSAMLQALAVEHYQERSPDMPHVVIDAGTGPVFIPLNRLVEGELRELLRPIDDLFRAKFRNHYKLPLLPTPHEAEDIKRMWTVALR
jgi:hypothetical protein